MPPWSLCVRAFSNVHTLYHTHLRHGSRAAWLDSRQARWLVGRGGWGCVVCVSQRVRCGGGTRSSMKKVTPGTASATCNVVAGARTAQSARSRAPAARPTHTRGSLLARLHCRDTAARLPAPPQPSPSRATTWVVPRGATVRFLPWAMAGRVSCTRTYLTSAT